MFNLTHKNPNNRFSFNPTVKGRTFLMVTAHKILKAKNNVDTFSEALKLAWKRLKISVVIFNAKGAVPFTFLKEDKKNGGFIKRNAVAKHNVLISPKQYNINTLKNPYVFAFLDLSEGHTTAAKFRYFRIDRLVKFPFVCDNSNAFIHNTIDIKGNIIKTQFVA